MSQETVIGIIRRFGTQQRLAEAIGTTQSVIAGWKRRGVIPARQQQLILDAARRSGIELTPAEFFEATPAEAAA